MGKQSRKKREHRQQPPARTRDEVFQNVVRQGPPDMPGADPGMEEAFDEEGQVSTWEPLYSYSTRTPLWLSTAALKNLARMAREVGMSRLLDPAVEADLDPNARHVVVWAARHWSYDFKYDNVRALLAIGTKSAALRASTGGEVTALRQIVDLPTRQFALMIMLGAANPAQSPVHAKLAEDLGLDVDQELGLREWTGTRSMDRVAGNLTAYWHLMAAFEVYGTPGGVAERFSELGWPLDEIEEAIQSGEGPRVLQAPPMLRKLHGAHPIVCEPEWTQAMDDFESWDEALALARTLHLPFDIIYLDLMGNGGYCPLVPVTSPNHRATGAEMQTIAAQNRFMSAKLSGALLFRDLGSSDRLVIIPFGAPGHVPDGTSGYTKIDPLGFGVTDALGVITFDSTPEEPLWELEASVQGSNLTRQILCAAPFGEGPRGASPVKMPVRIELPFNMEQLKAQSSHPPEFAHMWASVTWAAARRALRTMHMLQAGNVELVDALVSRQVRRAGERAGRPISQQVVVRLNRKQYSRPPGLEEGEPVEWSHAWWVSGHPRYYPLGTRKADAQPPEKLINHPMKGLCFMEWVSPFIKGNRAKGVVEKTRIIKDRAA